MLYDIKNINSPIYMGHLYVHLLEGILNEEAGYDGHGGRKRGSTHARLLQTLLIQVFSHQQRGSTLEHTDDYRILK